MPKINKDIKADKSKNIPSLTTLDLNNFPKDNSYSNKAKCISKLPTSNNFFSPPQELPAKPSSLPAQNLQIRREDILPGDIIISVGSIDPGFSEAFLQKAFDEYHEGSFERLAPLGSQLNIAQSLISNSTGHNDIVHAGLCVGFDNEGSSYDLVLKGEDNFLAPGKLYISIDKSNTFFDYYLLDPKGKRIEGKILVDDLTRLNFRDFITIHDLRAVKNEILAITLHRGHTDCKTPIIRDLHGKVQDMSIYRYYIPTTLRVFRPNLPSLLFEKAMENILQTQTEEVKSQWNNRHLCRLLKLSEFPETPENLSRSHYILVKNDKVQQFHYYNALKKKHTNLYPTDEKFKALEEYFSNTESGEQLTNHDLIAIDFYLKHSHLEMVETDRFYMPGQYTSKWDPSLKHLLQIGLTPSNFFAPANMTDLRTEKEMICSKLIIQSYKILLTQMARDLQIDDEHEFVRNYMNLMDNSLPKTLEGYLKTNVNFVEMIIPTHFNAFDRIGEIIESEGTNNLQALYKKLTVSTADQYVKASKFADEANKLGLKMPAQLKAFLTSQAIIAGEKNQKGSHHNLAEQYENGKDLFDTMLRSEVIKNSPELKAQIQEKSNQYSAEWQHYENQKGFFDSNFGYEASTIAKTALIAGGICYLTSGF